jgi:glycolate oxidase FAD binding subunit
MSAGTSLVDVLPGAAVDGGADRWPWIAGRPEAVVRPASAEEAAATMRWASENDVGVAVVSSGKRFRGARLTGRPFLILSTERLVGMEAYEPADLTLTAGAGTPVSTVARELGAHRQWLPYDPPQVEERSLGGLVSTGESGPLWMGYGELRNHVLGATVVTGDGRVLRLGGRVVKNVAGFDLLKAVVGSRGRLAVITSICLRAFPVPPTDRLLALRGESVGALLPAARSVGTAPVLPVSSVIVSPAPVLSAGAALLVRLHGAAPTVDADATTLARHCCARFEPVQDAAAVAKLARDHAAGAALELSVLPSRLGEALTALGESVGDAPVAIDTYEGTVRAAAGAIDAAGTAALRARVEALGGSVWVATTGADAAAAAEASRPSGAAAELTARLERVFDPRGALWPCRP